MQLVKQPLTKIILKLLQQTAKPLLDILHHKTVNPYTAGASPQFIQLQSVSVISRKKIIKLSSLFTYDNIIIFSSNK